MSNVFDKEAIRDFITSSDDNLMLALGVLSIEGDIRQYIVQDFLKRLKIQLIDELTAEALGDDWEILIDTDTSYVRYSSLFQLKKNSWGDNYSIMIEPQQVNTNQLCYGIRSKNNQGLTTEGLLIHQLVTDAINAGESRLDRAQPTGHWLYTPWVSNELRHWGNPETLSLLADKTNTKALNYFCGKFIALAKITEQKLDKIMQESI